MTGVGSNGAVARPEVVIEGSHDGAEWFEIEFKHKPGKLMFYVCFCKRCIPDYPVRARDSHTTNMHIVTITCVFFWRPARCREPSDDANHSCAASTET